MSRAGLAALCCIVATCVRAQTIHDRSYNEALSELRAMLTGKTAMDLDRAVFVVENAYLDGSLDSSAFESRIAAMVALAKGWDRADPDRGYRKEDSVIFRANRAVFAVMMDTTFIAPGVPACLPMHYDPVDPFGSTDHTKGFVSKLMLTWTGNCHSLPLFYKMVCERMGGKAWLARAPMHLYLKQYSEQHGWYNTELTSGVFPMDAWLMATGYVSADAIRSGIYMDTLSLAATIALCVTDLAQGYQWLVPKGNEDFMLRCCELALQYDPRSVPALLLKNDALSKLVLSSKGALRDAYYAELNSNATRLVELDYRAVPVEVYRKWMEELSQAEGKYRDLRLMKAEPVHGQ